MWTKQERSARRPHAAAGAGHGEALDLLLEAGCNDRALPGKAATPSGGVQRTSASRTSYSKRERPEQMRSDGTSALMVASWHGDAGGRSSFVGRRC